jgi:hypothetical protein
VHEHHFVEVTSMSRNRKRIAAVTIMMVSVLGLGLAGYIQATRASGRDTIAGKVNDNGLHRYRLNHQIGTGGEAFARNGANEYASTFEEHSTQLAGNESAGSNEPENSDEADAANLGTSQADGTGAGPGASGDVPFAGSSAAGGDGYQGSSMLRLAGTFGSGYLGGTRGGNAQGGDAPTGNEPSGSTNPPGVKTDNPTDTGGPVVTGPKDPPDVNPPSTYVPDDSPPPAPVSVPEPATLGLLGFGIAAMGFMRRRRAQAS